MSLTPIFKSYVFSLLHGRQAPIGIIQQNTQAQCYDFAYAQSWLSNKDAFPLDPLCLPLSDHVFQSERLPFALADALPDRWGKRILQTYHPSVPKNEIEWLIAARGYGVGCLAFSSDKDVVLAHIAPPTLNDLEKLVHAASEIESRSAITHPEWLKLFWYGSSMGGARPKTSIIDDKTEWLAKFSSISDTFDCTKAEYACLSMAKDAGICVPQTRLVSVAGHSVLLVKRFDRKHNEPVAHYISGHTLLNMRKVRSRDTYDRFSYAGIALELRKFSQNAAHDSSELFRRMVFNVFIGNTDDHLRNHGVLYIPDYGWRLSPAFDLLPHPQNLNEHALGIGSQGRESSLLNALSRTPDFGMSTEQSLSICHEVASVVKHSRNYFKNAGCSEIETQWLGSLCDRIDQAVGLNLSR